MKKEMIMPLVIGLVLGAIAMNAYNKKKTTA